MDELEPDLRAAFDRLADGPEPSDDLIHRTVDRGGYLRRRRHVVTASTFTILALTVTVVVASVAGAGSPSRNLQVASPFGDGQASTTTTPTTILATPTSVAPPPGPRVTTRPTPGSTTAPAVSFVPQACPSSASGSSPETEAFTLLADGDIRVHYGWARSSDSLSFVAYRFDDGVSGRSDYLETYTPAQFGPHWYDEWSHSAAGTDSCRVRHTFVVDPVTATPETTTTTTAPTTTTIPDTTTTPDTTAPTTTTVAS